MCHRYLLQYIILVCNAILPIVIFIVMSNIKFININPIWSSASTTTVTVAIVAATLCTATSNGWQLLYLLLLLLLMLLLLVCYDTTITGTTTTAAVNTAVPSVTYCTATASSCYRPPMPMAPSKSPTLLQVDALMNSLVRQREEDPSVKSLVVSQFTSLLTVIETPLR